ncbi:OsmC family protein [Nonlabens sp.]|uniref:OsmC family protein n=1 Tax=Nonlabens sp. TaxID=1888209 RepID=UPI0025F75990|nr:OsmC family protein [Nonlabens sp.]
MNKQFRFEVTTQWKKGDYKNSKTHLSKIAGKPDVTISAARAFKGQEDQHNPEDLLLSALSSCHMMSYFYVCQQQGIEVVDYKDKAVGTLELRPNFSGGFTKVQLNPLVTISNASQEILAIDLHKKAHELCFIANSVNFEVIIDPVIESLER